MFGRNRSPTKHNLKNNKNNQNRAEKEPTTIIHNPDHRFFSISRLIIEIVDVNIIYHQKFPLYFFWTEV